MTNELPTQEKKLIEEIESLREERRSGRWKFYLELIRTVAIGVGAIIIFWAVQQPESLLNRSASRETIARERAKLILEWLKEPDSNRRLQALAVIKAAYGSTDDGWLKDIEEIINKRTRAEAILQDIHRMSELKQTRERLQKQLELEYTGEGGSRMPGAGPMYAKLKTELSQVEREIEDTMKRLQEKGFDVRQLNEK